MQKPDRTKKTITAAGPLYRLLTSPFRSHTSLWDDGSAPAMSGGFPPCPITTRKAQAKRRLSSPATRSFRLLSCSLMGANPPGTWVLRGMAKIDQLVETSKGNAASCRRLPPLPSGLRRSSRWRGRPPSVGCFAQELLQLRRSADAIEVLVGACL